MNNDWWRPRKTEPHWKTDASNTVKSVLEAFPCKNTFNTPQGDTETKPQRRRGIRTSIVFNKSRDKTSKPLTCRAQTANTATRGRQPWMQSSRQQQRRIMTGSAFCCNATPRIHLYRVYWVMNSSSSSFRHEDVRSASTVARKHLKCWKLKEVKRC